MLLNRNKLNVALAMAVSALVVTMYDRYGSLKDIQRDLTECSFGQFGTKPSLDVQIGNADKTIADLDVNEESAKVRMDARKSHLQKVCQGLTLDENVAKQRDLEITIARGKLKLCGLEKTASTFMKHLRARENAPKRTSRDRLENKDAPPENLPKDENDFKSFIVVREPYGRLVSGYIDKLYTRTIWWKMMGKYIIENFRFKPTPKEKECGSDVSFTEFIRYWIHAQETNHRRDGHFQPMHEECQFCHWDYDYYAHMETLKSDMKFIYESNNLTLMSTFVDEEETMRDKASDIIGQRKAGQHVGCEEGCNMLERAWWSFHARGLIALDVKLPLQGEACQTVERREFEDIAWQAHVESEDRIDKPKQRRQMMVSLYLQLPLLDRLKVREVFMRDFELFGYDSTPKDMFPELY